MKNKLKLSLLGLVFWACGPTETINVVTHQDNYEKCETHFNDDGVKIVCPESTTTSSGDVIGNSDSCVSQATGDGNVIVCGDINVITTNVSDDKMCKTSSVSVGVGKIECEGQGRVIVFQPGKDGVDGVNGNDGTDGRDGENGKDGIDGKDGTNGIDGVDGSDGQNGKDGINGTSCTQHAISGGSKIKCGSTTVIIHNGKDGKDGKDGVDGTDGKDGADGQNGVDGTNGNDGTDGAFANTKLYEAYRATTHALWFPSYFGPERRFRFSPMVPGQFVIHPNGTATLKGELRGVDKVNQGMTMELNFRLRSNTAPAGSPKMGPNIPANTNTSPWFYYESTNGVLTGTGKLEGLRLVITRKGESFQVGEGANWLDMDFGASGWFYYTIENNTTDPAYHVYCDNPKKQHGDINLDLIEIK